MTKQRCAWAESHPLLQSYHDKEWGVPTSDDRKLFEFLVLESAQAGLSWLTILKRREGYRKAFADFDARKVAEFSSADVERLMQDAGIIRNRMKIEAAITNARHFLEVQQEFGSFAQYFWQFVKGKPIQNRFRQDQSLPATTALSDRISRDLKQRGFRFMGSTIVYAHMQAMGLVNDHVMGCFRHGELLDN